MIYRTRRIWARSSALTGAVCHLVGDNGGVHQLTRLNLADIDPQGAEFTIGDTGADLNATALDPAGGDLYAATADQLHTVDTATGAITTIGCRTLVVMGGVAGATTEALSMPLALLLLLLIGFVTVGRIGLYLLLWRGDRHRGTISFFDDEKHFRLIEPDGDGEAVFVHAHAFPRRQRATLQAGTRVRYRLLASDNRANAWGATTEDTRG